MQTLPTFDSNAALMQARLRVSGKFLRVGDEKVRLRGISYGPFRPNSAGFPFPEDSRLTSDLEHLSVLKFDTIRLYDSPSDHLLSEAQRLGLRDCQRKGLLGSTRWGRCRCTRQLLFGHVRGATLGQVCARWSLLGLD